MDYSQTGWLDPKGKLYAADYMEHYSVSEEIIEEQGFKRELGEPLDDVLIKHGYVRISMQRFLSYGLVFGFPHHDIEEEWNGKTYTFHSPYVSPQQREYIRKIYENHRDIISEFARLDLQTAKIITEEEYWEWIKEVDPEQYAKWYATE